MKSGIERKLQDELKQLVDDFMTTGEDKIYNCCC
jgi:hypothetical protein